MDRNRLLPLCLAAALALSACGGSSNSSSASSTSPASSPSSASSPASTPTSAQDALATTTPIKHVVVIFGENNSFDHYFGTYPVAKNLSGEPAFTAKAGTPTVNGLTDALLNANPNSTAAGNGSNQKNPFRLDRTQANTEDQNHGYTAEQQAYDNGAMDLFPEFTGNNSVSSVGAYGIPGLVMGYFDGNTVTAEWNYAQNFAMSDDMYTDTYGPSTPGAIEVVSGQTNGTVPSTGVAVGGTAIADSAGGFTLIGDADPTGDKCSGGTTATMSASNRNIGDLLNAAGITWGGFTGGFDLTRVNANGTVGCNRTTYSSVLDASPKDYVAHHNWFQYYASTANYAHTRPSSVDTIGASDPLDSTGTPVHHQYDVNDFFTAVSAGNFPSVSYLKAPAIDDGHPGNSDPLDEQRFVTTVVNFLEQQPDWKNTAVIVTYDDSDGWYDHQFTAPTWSSSDGSADRLSGTGQCTSTGAQPAVGVQGGQVNGRCGPGTRIPLIVISPYARQNYVDHSLITQASVVKFIEDNWLGGTRIGNGSHDATTGSLMNLFDFTNGGSTPKLYLDESQGTVLTAPPALPKLPVS